jgi:hypothetical protein
MHGARGRRLALIAAFAAVVAAGPALAARCEQPCKAETAACIRARCARPGAGGAAHLCGDVPRDRRLRADPDAGVGGERDPLRRDRGPSGAARAARQLRAGDRRGV